MKQFGLGDFSNQLSIDQVNGALGNVGADYRMSGAQPADAPGAPSIMPQQAPQAPQQQQEAQKQGGGIGNILGLVGQFMGGGYGAALSAAGGMVGGKKK